jgi:hypothetical protein
MFNEGPLQWALLDSGLCLVPLCIGPYSNKAYCLGSLPYMLIVVFH